MLRRQTLIALAAAIILGIIAVYVANTYIVGAQRSASLREPT
jgi:putative flippase GtrA